jgi:hypothetical protein
MMSADLLDLLRVSLGFLVIFGVAPWLVALNSPPEARGRNQEGRLLARAPQGIQFVSEGRPQGSGYYHGLPDDELMAYCAAFVRASLFTGVATLVLGSVRLCLPGSLAAAYVVFLFTLMYRSGALRRFRDRHWLLGRLHTLIVFADRLPSESWHLRPIRIRYVSWRRRFDLTALAPFRSICLFSWLVALAACFYPLHDARFLHGGSYSRALALQKLALGQPSVPDGSAALLAPVMFLSGCDGATVVRFAGPLFAAVFVLTAFIVVYRLTGSSRAGLAGAGLAAGFAAFADAGQLQADGLASIFLLLGVLLWKASRLDAMGSFAVALLIDPIPGPHTIGYAGIPLGIALLAHFCRPTLRWGAGICAPVGLAAIVCLICAPRNWEKEGPYQYETAARAVCRITRELPHNTWLVVAPVQELAFTYGRGWHMELSEFVGKYSVDEASQPGFHFGFPVMDTFVFVEKQPLVSRAMGSSLSALGPRFDPAMAPYQVQLSRASMEFEAGRLLAAYRSRHPDVQVFVEDKDLIVYRIPG